LCSNNGVNGERREKEKTTNKNSIESYDEHNGFEYLPGTQVYFGSRIALQARHGGYLSFLDPSNIKAAAHKRFPTTNFAISNCDDPTDTGILRYGDAVWLQAGVHEVLGADFGSGSNIAQSETRNIVPALINARRENLYKAHQYGRWIVLNREEPLDTLGESVNHLSKIILEQEWYFLGSTGPTNAIMQKNCSFEEALKGIFTAIHRLYVSIITSMINNNNFVFVRQNRCFFSSCRMHLDSAFSSLAQRK